MNWTKNGIDTVNLKCLLNYLRETSSLLCRDLVAPQHQEDDSSWPLRDLQPLDFTLKIPQTWKVTARSRRGHDRATSCSWQFRNCEQICFFKQTEAEPEFKVNLVVRRLATFSDKVASSNLILGPFYAGIFLGVEGHWHVSHVTDGVMWQVNMVRHNWVEEEME